MMRATLLSLGTLIGLAVSTGCQSPGGHANKAGVGLRPASDSTTATADAGLRPRVKIATTMGDIVCELDGEQAPAPVIHFLQYVRKGFYDNTLFHRVLPDALIQGGGYTPDMELKPATLSAPMPHRWDNDLKNGRGTIAMIRGRGPAGTGTAEFFINVVDNRHLDQGPARGMATVFGKVVEGMDVVDRIRQTPVTADPKYAEGRSAVVPAEPVIIKSITLLTAYDQEALEASVAAIPGLAERVAAVVKTMEKQAGRPVVTTDSGLKYVDLHIGNGASPLPDDLVEFQYRGTLLDGTEFESTYQKQPAIRRVSDLIPGLQETLTTMNEGGKRTVVVPPAAAFGTGGIPGFIPGDSTVVFEIELLGIR